MTAQLEVPPTAEELLPTRDTLLSRLKDWDDTESWGEFFKLYWKFIYGVARKSRLTDAEAREVVHETIIYVSRKMPDFKYDRSKGSFKGWLTQLTKWRIADQFRKRDGNLIVFVPPESGAVDPFLNYPDPASVNPAEIDEQWDGNLVAASVEKVKALVSPKQYQIFDLYVIKQWPVKQVAAALGVSSMRVYLAKTRISRLLRKELEKLQNRY
jgi:RNA polymerase sigma factor (sigma-70 family)